MQGKAGQGAGQDAGCRAGQGRDEWFGWINVQGRMHRC